MLKPIKVSSPRDKGLNKVVNGESLELLSLDLLVIGKGETLEYSTGGSEAAFVPLKGGVDIRTGGTSYRLKRMDVFSEPGSALCVPMETSLTIEALFDSEIAVCKCRTDRKGKIIYIPKESVRKKTVGRDSWRRTVVDIIDSTVPAQRLVLGETYNEPGGWSSFPPHKHDTHIPGLEARMEEVYLFRIDPPDGFGNQTIYSPGQGEYPFTVKDYDAVTIPWGYHPVSAMPGARLYYLWFLAGEGRTLKPRTDPRYTYLLE